MAKTKTKTTKPQKATSSSLKTASIIDFIKYVTVEKREWNSLSEMDKKAFNPFMMLRWISMNMDYTTTMNLIQPYCIGVLDKKLVYDLFLDLLPRSTVYIRYVKGTKEDQYNSDLVNIIRNHYEVSIADAIAYLDIYNSTAERNSELEALLVSYGLDDKEIKKLLK